MTNVNTLEQDENEMRRREDESTNKKTSNLKSLSPTCVRCL